MGYFNSGLRRLFVERLEDRRVLTADFNGNGMVDAPDLDIWKTGFGTVGTATQSTGDANGDTNVDGSDFLLWQRTLGQSTLPPRAPENVQARALSASSIQVAWDASATATSYIVVRRAVATETAFTIIAPSVVGLSFTDTLLATDTLYEYRILAHRNPDSVPSKPAQATTNQSNLTAYRPQSTQFFDSPTNGPIYDPLPKTPVGDVDELSTTLGPGIRINADDDNQNSIQDRSDTSAIAQENDLIEVKIDQLPGAGSLSLSIGGRLQVFYHHDRTQQVLSGDPLGFVNDTATVFVEWFDGTHGTELLTLVDAAQTPLDSVRFHSFRSIVIVFGGNTQSPDDSDGDGSMGDPITGLLSPEGNREGIFDLATTLYVTGWDVLAYDEEELVSGGAESSIAYEEVTNALDMRFVGADYGGGFSIMGYSQGGGATHDLIEAIYSRDESPKNVTSFGVYVDAVDHTLPDDGAAPETRWPFAVLYLLNFYQTHGLPRGGDIDDEEALGELEEYDVNDTPGLEEVGHQQIDDTIQVHQLIRQRLLEVVGNR